MLTALSLHFAVTTMALNSQGITAFILKTLVPIALAIIGCLIIFGAKKGNWSQVMSTTGIVIVGIVMIVGAGGFVAFGDQLAGIVFSG